MTTAVTISIDRTSLSLSALAFSGSLSGGTTRGIIKYIPPAKIQRRVYATDSSSVNGSELLTKAKQQAILGFDWYPIGAANETAVQAAFAEVEAALDQFEFEVTTQISGAPAQVWSADAGDIQLGGSDGRTYVDLNHLCPIYSVSIPVYPVPA